MFHANWSLMPLAADVPFDDSIYLFGRLVGRLNFLLALHRAHHDWSHQPERLIHVGSAESMAIEASA